MHVYSAGQSMTVHVFVTNGGSMRERERCCNSALPTQCGGQENYCLRLWVIVLLCYVLFMSCLAKTMEVYTLLREKDENL